MGKDETINSVAKSGFWGPPNAVAILFLALTMLPLLFFQKQMLNADGDLATHIFLGRKVLEYGIAFKSDWAHTKFGDTFIAFEWLSEVVFVQLHNFGGLAAVLVAASLAIAVSLTLIAKILSRRLSPLILLPTVFLIASLASSHWVVRPHLNSFLALPFLLLLTTREISYRSLPLFGALFFVWANFHPGFVYGLIVLGAFLAGDALDRGWRNGILLHALIFASAFAATFLNPLGWGLHLHIIEVLADRRAYELISEYRRTNPLEFYGVVYYSTLSLCVAIAVVTRRRPAYSTSLAFGVAALLAILSIRNVSLFALYALPLFFWDFGRDLQARIPAKLVAANQKFEEDDKRGKALPWIGGMVIALCIIASTQGRIGPFQVIPNHFSSEVFPVEAVQKARDTKLERMKFFHIYIWGGYLLYAWPEQKIYIDGQSNYFGSELIEEYLKVEKADPGWENILRERDINAILIWSDSRLADTVRNHPDWSIWHEDQTAIIFLRR